MDVKNIEDLEKVMRHLPSLSMVVADVLDAIETHGDDIDYISRKISQDQSLSSRVLRVANSPFYGMTRKIGRIKEANVVLGINAVRNIVMSSSIMEYFPDRKEGLDQYGFWLHSFAVAIAASTLAEQVSVDQDAAFISGLLHDIGKLVLSTFIHDDYQTIITQCEKEQSLILDMEQKVLGYDHAYVGSRLMRLWNLPDELVTTIRCHHELEKDKKYPKMTCLVHVADCLCRALDVGNPGDPYVQKVSPYALSVLGLTMHDLTEGIERVFENVSYAEGIIGDIQGVICR